MAATGCCGAATPALAGSSGRFAAHANVTNANRARGVDHSRAARQYLATPLPPRGGLWLTFSAAVLQWVRVLEIWPMRRSKLLPKTGEIHVGAKRLDRWPVERTRTMVTARVTSTVESACGRRVSLGKVEGVKVSPVKEMRYPNSACLTH